MYKFIIYVNNNSKGYNYQNSFNIRYFEVNYIGKVMVNVKTSY